MKNKTTCIIPRNLNKSDFIKMPLGIKLNLSDIPVLLLSGIISYLITESYENVILKFITFAIIMIIGYLLTNIKYENQKSPELVMNTIVYHGRKNKYKKGDNK